MNIGGSYSSPVGEWAALTSLAALATLIVGSAVRAAPPITAAALAPDGRQVVLGSQDGIERRSWPELAKLGQVPTKLAHVHDLRFAPNGQTLVAAGGAPGEHGELEWFRWPDASPGDRAVVHGDVVYRTAWSRDGKFVATASGDGTCRVFGVTPGGGVDANYLRDSVCQYTGHSQPVMALDFLPEGPTVVSAGVDQTLRLWDSSTGRHVRSLDNHVGPINALAVRPAAHDSNAPLLVATASDDRTVRLWQPTLPRLVRFARLPSPPRCIAWSTDRSRLYVGCNDGRVRVLAVETLEIEQTLEGLNGRIHELVVDPAAPRILVCGVGGFRRLAVE